MFPPATPTTERIRADMENREITRRAALLAGVSQPRRLSFFRRLLNSLRRTPTLPTQPVRPASGAAKNA
jgi:hypothetical protein